MLAETILAPDQRAGRGLTWHALQQWHARKKGREKRLDELEQTISRQCRSEVSREPAHPHVTPP